MQAARGTSVDPSATDEALPPRRGRALCLVVAGLGLAIDLITKELALAHLDPGRPVAVLGSVLQFRLIRNPGAAFSLGEGVTPVFTVLALAVLIFVLGRLVPRLGHRGWAVALGLLCAGVGGNLLDRLIRDPGPFRGHVIDFLELPNWPIFNVADMCITTAAILIAALSIFVNVAVTGQRYPRRTRA